MRVAQTRCPLGHLGYAPGQVALLYLGRRELAGPLVRRHRLVPPVETEEDFYPPDHHMHPSNRAPDPDPRAGAQAEFDLTSPPVDGPKP